MSIQTYLTENADTIKKAAPADFFEWFANKTFELAIEIIHREGQLETEFISVRKSDLLLFCAVHSIKCITYYQGEMDIFVIRMSMLE